MLVRSAFQVQIFLTIKIHICKWVVSLATQTLASLIYSQQAGMQTTSKTDQKPDCGQGSVMVHVRTVASAPTETMAPGPCQASLETAAMGWAAADEKRSKEETAQRNSRKLQKKEDNKISTCEQKGRPTANEQAVCRGGQAPDKNVSVERARREVLGVCRPGQAGDLGRVVAPRVVFLASEGGMHGRRETVTMTG